MRCRVSSLKTSDALVAALAAGAHAVGAAIGVAVDDVNHEIQVSYVRSQVQPLNQSRTHTTLYVGTTTPGIGTVSENAVRIDSIEPRIAIAKIRP